MTTNTFATHAPDYWDRNLSVVPLEGGTKRPAGAIGNWAGYGNNLPSSDKRQSWLGQFAECGIGLLMNMEIMPGFNLGAIDVDRDELVGAVQVILGNPPCRKRGKKGETFFIRTARTDKLKKTTIADYAGRQAVDVLLGNSMSVLPPSLHPDSGQSYVWTGKRLLDCGWNELPVLDRRRYTGLKILIESEFTPVILTGEGTHDAGLRLTAQLVGAQCTDEEIAAIIQALLPKGYRGNSLDELPAWIQTAREKGFDRSDDEDAKEVLSAKVVKAVYEAGVDLFHDGDSAFASVPTQNGFLTYAVHSTAFLRWLRKETYQKLERPLTRGLLGDVVATLEAQALYHGEHRPVHLRIAGDADSVEIDLGHSDGKVVRITANGWELCPTGAYRFYRSSGFEALPAPIRGGDLSDLRGLLNLEEESFHLLIGFLVNGLKPTGPFMALLVEGEQGSGKSVFSTVVKALVDPNRAAKLRLPDNDRDLMIQAKEYRLLAYDNASGMRAEISDALCTLATGGGIAVRRLYTNDELQVFSLARPFLINGIAGYANRPDLLERAIPIRLRSMPDEARRTEGEILEEFERLKPGILGALYDAVSCALENYSSIYTPQGFRMADAARWIAAAEPAFGTRNGAVLRAISEAQERLLVERINDHNLVIAIRRVLDECRGVFDGHIGKLYRALIGLDEHRDRALPKTTQQLSSQLVRLRPAMEKAGLAVEFPGRDKQGRRVRITMSDEPQPTTSPKF